MHRDYNVIICIPFGRRRFVDLLLRYLMREYDIIDEIRFWMNTTCEEDLSWGKRKVFGIFKSLNLITGLWKKNRSPPGKTPME